MDRIGPGPSSACSAPVKSRTWIKEFQAILVRQIGSLPARRLWFEDYNEVYPLSRLLDTVGTRTGSLTPRRQTSGNVHPTGIGPHVLLPIHCNTCRTL